MAESPSPSPSRSAELAAVSSSTRRFEEVTSVNQLIANGDVNVSVEGLADLLIGIYDELNQSKLKKEKTIHDFIKQYVVLFSSSDGSNTHAVVLRVA